MATGAAFDFHAGMLKQALKLNGYLRFMQN